MRALGYFFVGYLILSLGSVGLFTGGLTGIVTLLVAAAGLALLVRSYRGGRISAGAGVQLALRVAPADVAALLRRVERRATELSARLPEEPLDSDAFVTVRHALIHEPEDVRSAFESEYASARAELDRVQAAAERLGADWREHAVPADDAVVEARGHEAALAELESYADGLEARAHASGEAADIAVETVARAQAALAEAERRPGVSPAELGGARESLSEAAEALEPGRERPLTARKLALDALRQAEAAEERADAERALPGDVERRRAAVAERQSALAEAVARIGDNLALAASRSARSCVVDIETGAAAARQLLEQVNGAASRASQPAGTGLKQAAAQLATALRLLDQAEPLVERVEGQLAELARTALAAREAVGEAEAATDSAWAALEQGSEPGGTDGAREVAREARRLAERARAALGEQAPDWFEIRELSERALRLVRALEPTAGATADPSHSDDLEAARAGATAAREHAWSLALSAYATGAYRAAEVSEAAYQEALRLESDADERPSAEATRRAVEAFREAERVARRAAAQADDERLQISTTREADVTGLVAATALAAFLGSAFGD